MTATSALPAWKPLAMTDLISEDWRLARLACLACPPCLLCSFWPGSLQPCGHRVLVLRCHYAIHMTPDSQDNSPTRIEGETEAQRGSRTCPWTMGARVRTRAQFFVPLSVLGFPTFLTITLQSPSCENDACLCYGLNGCAPTSSLTLSVTVSAGKASGR